MLLFLHGGGYEFGSLRSDGELAARLGRASGMRVLFPEYRLAPEHPFPAAIDDVLAAWRWLRTDQDLSASSIAVAGDSAGGGLAVALLVATRDAGEALPAAAALMSPTVDLTSSGASMTERADQDPFSTPAMLRQFASDYLAGADPKTPLASPLFASLAGLPPLLVQVGTAEAMPAQLSMGQRKLIGVARALAAEPRLLCLDEPAAGLDTRESEEFGARLRGLADRGQSMLLIEHDMGLVLGICDRVIVLEFGQVIAEGLPDAVRQDSRVIAAYLGGGTASGSGTDDAGTDDGGIMSSTLAELAAQPYRSAWVWFRGSASWRSGTSGMSCSITVSLISPPAGRRARAFRARSGGRRSLLCLFPAWCQPCPGDGREHLRRGLAGTVPSRRLPGERPPCPGPRPGHRAEAGRPRPATAGRNAPRRGSARCRHPGQGTARRPAR